MVPFGGWELPVAYGTGTVAEHMACRQHAAVFDVSHLGSVQVEGPDAFGLLQSTFTNDLARIEPGGAQYTHLLDEDGSIADDIIVWWLAPELFHVMPNAANCHRVTAAVGGRDITAERALLAVQGPRARARLADVVPGAAGVARFRVAHVAWHGTTLTVAGTGYTGEDGVELAVAVDAAGELWTALVGSGVQPAGLGARDTLRLEAGLPLHGHDLGPGITPLQAGLGWVVRWDKGDFRGRAALEAERASGPRRLLRGIKGDARRPLRDGAVVRATGQEVGHLTSGGYSPVLEAGIGLGLVSPDVAVGDAVEVDLRGRLLPARVVDLPFIPLPSSAG
jgi:aminomethyltransferase